MAMNGLKPVKEIINEVEVLKNEIRKNLLQY